MYGFPEWTHNVTSLKVFLKALTFNIHGLKENVEILNYYPF